MHIRFVLGRNNHLRKNVLHDSDLEDAIFMFQPYDIA